MKIEKVSLVQELQDSYLAYSLSVIQGRALPCLYDGLKPVHRRILYAMSGMGLKSDGRYVKSQRVVGETMGKYHPHGDSYGSMVTLAAPHSNNHRLIDGHGNWGSPTDNAAAARYTECRLSPFSEQVLLDNLSRCETRRTYDDSRDEPVTLEVKLPNVLLLGGEGIGVGYSTNIPQHNLRGVVSAMKLLASKGTLTAKRREQLIPDFPSGCDVMDTPGLQEYLSQGKGSLTLRAKCSVSKLKRSGRKADWEVLEFTCLPYGVSTEKVGQQIRDALDKGYFDRGEIQAFSDLSDLSGQRLTVSTKEGSSKGLINKLYHLTSLEHKFAASNVVVKGGMPTQMSPVSILKDWINWRDSRLVNQFNLESSDLKDRIHILEGMVKAVSKIKKVVDLIFKSANHKEAKAKLVEALGISEVQASAVLDTKLASLTRLSKGELSDKLESLGEELVNLNNLLSSKEARSEYLSKEWTTLATRHGNSRRSDIIPYEAPVQGRKRSVNKAAAKPKYLKINKKSGTIDYGSKARGAHLVLDPGEKLVVLGTNGVIKRFPTKYRGNSFDTPQPLLAYNTASKMSSETYLMVWENNGEIRASVVTGDKLCTTTAKGKRFVPEHSKVLYFGTGHYTLAFKGRKKDKKLTVDNVKPRPVGSVGNKICLSSALKN